MQRPRRARRRQRRRRRCCVCVPARVVCVCVCSCAHARAFVPACVRRHHKPTPSAAWNRRTPISAVPARPGPERLRHTQPAVSWGGVSPTPQSRQPTQARKPASPCWWHRRGAGSRRRAHGVVRPDDHGAGGGAHRCRIPADRRQPQRALAQCEDLGGEHGGGDG